MDWQTPVMIVETVALLVAATAYSCTRFRVDGLVDQVREHRAAVGFARHQAQYSVGIRFLQWWQDGSLDVRDPELFGEWMRYRSTFLRNLRAEP